jgi:hypothetical protein
MGVIRASIGAAVVKSLATELLAMDGNFDGRSDIRCAKSS